MTDHVRNTLSAMLATEDGDYTIRCGERQWKVHGAFVMHASEFLRVSISNPHFIESADKTLDLTDAGFDAQVIHAMIRHIYGAEHLFKTGNTEQTQNCAIFNAALYAAGEYFGLSSLKTHASAQFREYAGLDENLDIDVTDRSFAVTEEENLLDLIDNAVSQEQDSGREDTDSDSDYEDSDSDSDDDGELGYIKESTWAIHIARAKDIVKAAPFVWSTTPEGDRPLRDIIVKTLLSHHEDLMKEWEDIEGILKATPDLPTEVAIEYARANREDRDVSGVWTCTDEDCELEFYTDTRDLKSFNRDDGTLKCPACGGMATCTKKIYPDRLPYENYEMDEGWYLNDSEVEDMEVDSQDEDMSIPRTRTRVRIE